jgi:hypothetical protein
MRSVYPVKYYSDEGFVEHKIELGDEDLEEIIREYLERHADFDFDEVEVVNNRPMNIWLYAKCRKFVDPDAAAAEQEAEASKFGAEVNVTGEYDSNPTGR